ncbi:hypothetical protein HELRODRAFT_110053 [Helobdella robusta]|uniref:RNA helicase aquarius n=1 Tax=Helobdella robusta TaxID=6412 RepID=T1EEY8_HELRO|nr:hypothetical protein HELRODRAFT_110053 [Helobdella robusta]ESO09157.1 hypothetical protein HELRODRAFT_110053 [Helobdella robusta]
MATKRKFNIAPTVQQIQADVLTQLSKKYWAPFSDLPRLPYNAQVIDDIYAMELKKTHYSTRRIMLLEYNQFLENYLWPNYTIKSTRAHVLCIVSMVNEKFRERVPAWNCFQSSGELFEDFFHRVVLISLEKDISYAELCVVITFFIHAFNSLGSDLVRNQVMKLVTLLMWKNIHQSLREWIFEENTTHKKVWKKLNKAFDSLEGQKKVDAEVEVNFLANHLDKFLTVVQSFQVTGPIEPHKVDYCERFIEWMIDLLAQLPTRRLFNTLFHSKHFIVICRGSNLLKREEGKLFTELMDMLQFYAKFEINDKSGEALNEREVLIGCYDKMARLQKAIFKNFPELKSVALQSASNVNCRKQLIKHFSTLPNKRLHELVAAMLLVPSPNKQQQQQQQLQQLLSPQQQLLPQQQQQLRQSQLEQLNTTPLYPTEQIIWNENIVPVEYAAGGLALPKLNLQFLTIHDYLLRNFNLFRLESTYEIRQDVEDAVYRMKPWLGADCDCHFGGYARMAHTISSFTVVEVAKPNVGENQPACVRADLTISLNLKNNFHKEWLALRKHDVIFLVTVRPQFPTGYKFDFTQPFIPQVGLTYVRGCEIEGMLDDAGKVIEEGVEPKPTVTGDSRTFRVFLDANQYYSDLMNINKGNEDPYETFNLVIRRKPKENNFKAVLETIRDLMNINCVVPDWLINIILGYGDPWAAHYSKLPNNIQTMDWNDTFLNFDHLKASFPHHDVILATKHVYNDERANGVLPVEGEDGDGKKGDSNMKDTIIVHPYKHANRGPYRFNQPRRNQIFFTPTQIEAIRSGMQPGLTMVVGPPGTGKTDVAVQIISNIYHNFPEQRTLIVTHSNQALNQLFEKIMQLDVEERHLLRLGHGEEELETESDYSRYGRVNFVLEQRLELLQHVSRLHQSLNLPLNHEYTCELAGYFHVQEILARQEKFFNDINTARKDESSNAVEDTVLVSKCFPFHRFFEDAPKPLFKKDSFEEDLEVARGCFTYVNKIFKQLEEFRPFELLRNGRDRSRYLLIKEAKIIAMTCTHAALKRRDLVEAGFQYENILMEEAAQILEIETFIPLLLQNPEHGINRLKRWIMIGDHHQLPPVIKNMAFQKFSNMEQSLFTRFVRLGIPTVDLDAQGRSRPSICNLFNWRYKNLGNLPHILMRPEYKQANPGFFFDFQLIDVQDFNGVGESEPNPYFYQNLAEAEYVVALYTYMRLIGYPADQITILTTYNGQKHLIRDVIQRRCANNKLLGRPLKVTTVDRYQGQQNDYILLSLVRTKNVGHLRDVRRLVVAMSRARLGLYIFGRVSLFQNCFELTPTFSQLMKRPMKLWLAPFERFATHRLNEVPPPGTPLVMENMPHMTQYVFDFYKEHVQQLIRQQQLQYQQMAALNEALKPPTELASSLSSAEASSSALATSSSHQHKLTERQGSDNDDDDDTDDEEENADVEANKITAMETEEQMVVGENNANESMESKERELKRMLNTPAPTQDKDDDDAGSHQTSEHVADNQTTQVADDRNEGDVAEDGAEASEPKQKIRKTDASVGEDGGDNRA